MAGRVAENHSRRSIIALLFSAAGWLGVRLFAPLSAVAENGGAIDENIDALQPGQFVWHPERSPDGPVVIIVSIPKQLVFVYRNGILIGASTCSTGKPGHPTPVGVFTILQKARTHTSSKYDEAMPDMERLTWQGIALHVGDLPGYPASHGCVHLPPTFADNLYDITQIGTPVIIAGDHTDPISIADPGPILGVRAEEEIKARLGKKMPSPSTPNAVTSILVSSADRRIYLLENGDLIAKGGAVITDPGKPLGSNVFVWQGGDANGPGGSSWEGMGFHADPNAAVAPDTAVLERIDGAPDIMEAIRDRIRPGTVFVTTDQPATADTGSAKDFTIVDASAV
jgi:hypothetical protein